MSSGYHYADAPRRTDTVVLPADGATLATSLSRGLMLVAHTGNAHLGAPVDRSLLRQLARARAVAPRFGTLVANDDGAPGRVDLPEVIPFRHATSHTLEVIDGRIHLALHAIGEPGKPDVRVELRMSHLLLDRLAQHQGRRHRKDVRLALVGLVILTCAVVAALAIAA